MLDASELYVRRLGMSEKQVLAYDNILSQLPLHKYVCGLNYI